MRAEGGRRRGRRTKMVQHCCSAPVPCDSTRLSKAERLTVYAVDERPGRRKGDERVEGVHGLGWRARSAGLGRRRTVAKGATGLRELCEGPIWTAQVFQLAESVQGVARWNNQRLREGGLKLRLRNELRQQTARELSTSATAGDDENSTCCRTPQARFPETTQETAFARVAREEGASGRAVQLFVTGSSERRKPEVKTTRYTIQKCRAKILRTPEWCILQAPHPICCVYLLQDLRPATSQVARPSVEGVHLLRRCFYCEKEQDRDKSVNSLWKARLARRGEANALQVVLRPPNKGVFAFVGGQNRLKIRLSSSTID